MPIVINEVRAQIIAYKVGDRMSIDFYGERKRVEIIMLDSETVTFIDDDHNTDVLAHSDVKLVIEVPDIPSPGNATSVQPLEKLLCFNLTGLSKYRLSNLNNGQIGIAPCTTMYEYSSGAGRATSSPPLGGAFCTIPEEYEGTTSPIANSSGGVPSYIISSGGVLTGRTNVKNSPQTIVLTPAPNSHQVNGITFTPQYTEAPHDKSGQATILNT